MGLAWHDSNYGSPRQYQSGIRATVIFSNPDPPSALASLAEHPETHAVTSSDGIQSEKSE